MTDSSIPHIKVKLTQYKIVDGEYAFSVGIKNQFGETHTIFVKEADRNIFGKITSINGLTLRDMFTAKNITKYGYVGDEVMLLVSQDTIDDKIPHVEGRLTQYKIGNKDFHFDIDIKDQKGNGHSIFVKESERNIFRKMTSIDKLELHDMFIDDDVRKYGYDGNDEILLNKQFI